MEIVCDSCSARFDVPEERVGDRGAKLRCPECDVVVVIFPSEHVAMASDAEPTTEDLSAELPSGSSVPAEIKRLFAGEQVHPIGTEPPVLRSVVPRPNEGQLSVTPPPPRAARAPFTPTATLRRAAEPSAMVSRRFVDEPPRRPEPPIAPPALLEGPSGRSLPPLPPRSASGSPVPPSSVRSVPPTGSRASAPPPVARAPRPSETATQPPASERATTTAHATSPGARNRTGPTGGASPPRAQAYQSPPMSYAPPWGAAWNTNGTPAGPPPFPGHQGWTPGAPPPWQPYPTGASNVPPGARAPFTGTGTPAPSYGMAFTGTPAPASGHPQMMTTWQPAWMPAIVLGMERTTLGMLLGVVLFVGFVGSCMGIGTSRIFSPNPPVFAAPTMVPGTQWEHVEHRPRPVAPRPVPADRIPRLVPRNIARPIPVPVPAAPRSGFDVESDDVRDPWADDR